MPIRIPIGIAIFIGFLFSQNVFASPPLSIFQGTLSEAQVAAKLADRPLLVYIYGKSDGSARDMEKQTWQDKGLRQLIHDHYLITFVGLDSLTQPARLRYQLSSLPTLLFVHPQGRLMGSVEGFVAPKTLSTMLRRYEKRVHPPTPKHLAVKRPVQAPLSLNLATPSLYAQRKVAGLESYSLGSLNQSAKGSQTLGLLAGSFEQKLQLERAMRRLERIWPGKMYVYSEPGDATKPVYKLVLGTFEDQKEAQRYAEAMSRYAAVDTDLMDLSSLLE